MVTYHGLPFGAGHGLAKSLLSKGVEAASLRIATPHDVVFLTDEDRITMTPWVAEHRLHVFPNCSWLGGFEARAGLEPESRHLVMITRDSGQKNLDLAAKIFAQLPEDFRLSLFGMGTDSPALRSRFAAIMAAGALRRVQFCGETADVRGALQGATGLLVSSRYEGLSISMIEAMEMGLPVFSTPVGGTALIGRVHPTFGLLSDDARSSAVVIDQMTAAHILSPVENAERIHAAWAENFAPEAWTRRVRDLVDRVLERPADQPTLDDTPT
jgi:glycosyltransferase involved in cell wall biosynthesis